MSQITLKVMVKKKGEEVWEPVNVSFTKQAYDEAPNRKKFIKNLASKAFLGSTIEDVEYNY